MINAILTLLSILLLFTTSVFAESEKQEDWNLHFQTTAIGQGDPKFHSLYRGPLSLSPEGEIRETVTITLFFGTRLWKGGEFYIDPEISQGKGLSGVQGIAGSPDGEAEKAAKMQSSLFERAFLDNNVARAFLRQTFDLSDKYEHIDSDQNQLAGPQAISRAVITVGKISATDAFDNNLCSHDPRTQFLNWALMSNGAWDYPANAKGYTEGLTIEYIQPSYSLRWGGFLEPEAANQEALEYRFWKAAGQVLELERPYSVCVHPGKIRIMGFLNRAHMGLYKDAINSTDVDIAKTRDYRFKYGVGFNIEQEITKDLGAFMRLGWNDGRTESWAFTEVDRTASLGLSLKGVLWSRVNDTVGLAYLINGLSHEHKDYLETGGLGFIIGDGKLNYAPEQCLETYYNLNISKRMFLTFDYQFINNPGYNKDRGPVSIFSLRFHFEV